MCIQCQAHVFSILHMHLKWNQRLQRSHSLMFGGIQSQSWSCHCIFFCRFAFSPLAYPSGYLPCRRQFLTSSNSPIYFPSWEMSGFKLAHFIVSVLARYRVKVALRHTSFCHQWHRSINGRRTRRMRRTTQVWRNATFTLHLARTDY